MHLYPMLCTKLCTTIIHNLLIALCRLRPCQVAMGAPPKQLDINRLRSCSAHQTDGLVAVSGRRTVREAVEPCNRALLDMDIEHEKQQLPGSSYGLHQDLR